ncbi:unnamed protein product [Closterium sp. NIES-53]
MRRSATLFCCGEAGSVNDWRMPSPQQNSCKRSEENSPPLEAPQSLVKERVHRLHHHHPRCHRHHSCHPCPGHCGASH